jgi:aubergine-like protein
LNFIIQRPTNIFELQAPRPDAYTKAIDDLIQKNSDLQMLFVILPTNKIDNYAAVKKRLSVNIGIPSQCFLSKNVTNKGLMSVATKVVIQMNAKLGGEPWSCPVPVKKMMVVGFDVHHGVKGSGSQAVGAMVSTTTGTFASYFSTVSFHSSGDELARLMAADLIKCVEAYKQCMSELPDRIMFYRDAVGDGQLNFVIDTELEQIKKGLETFYAKEGQSAPKLSFIIVTKKTSSRIFTVNPKIDNPPPGTICDDVITLPERYDFFLVPQVARQGAVSPVNYNVIFDTQGLKAERMQAFTYKLCHLYFNWSGTVSVPAPCQYAHKLAFLTGTAIGSACNSKLSYNLHFL